MIARGIAQRIDFEIYVDGVTAQMTGDHNLWFGVGTSPAQTTNNLNSDPLFANRNLSDYHLTSTSPAKDAGLTIVPTNTFDPNPGPTIDTDKDGVLRAQGAAYDLGAYEFIAGSSVARPNPPGDVQAVVH